MLEQILKMQAEKRGVKEDQFKQEMHFPGNRQVIQLANETEQISAAVNFVINYTVTQGINSAVVEGTSPVPQESFSEIQI